MLYGQIAFDEGDSSNCLVIVQLDLSTNQVRRELLPLAKTPEFFGVFSFKKLC